MPRRTTLYSKPLVINGNAAAVKRLLEGAADARVAFSLLTSSLGMAIRFRCHDFRLGVIGRPKLLESKDMLRCERM